MNKNKLSKFLENFESKILKYPKLHKVLYTKQPSNVLLLILIFSVLISLMLTLAGCATYVEPSREIYFEPVVPPAIVIVPSPYYGWGWHEGYYHHRR